ncbi:MAG: hypothetical protein ACK448_09305 [Bacteroidota bacterium]|jgi:geranylgeranyl pyrophosphate synthase
MKTAKVLTLLIVLAAVVSSCGARKQDRCPSVGKNTGTAQQIHG